MERNIKNLKNIIIIYILDIEIMLNYRYENNLGAGFFAVMNI